MLVPSAFCILLFVYSTSIQFLNRTWLTCLSLIFQNYKNWHSINRGMLVIGSIFSVLADGENKKKHFSVNCTSASPKPGYCSLIAVFRGILEIVNMSEWRSSSGHSLINNHSCMIRIRTTDKSSCICLILQLHWIPVLPVAENWTSLDFTF